mgnify:CR=1 FL=1
MGARETALNALIACRKEGAWSNGVLKEYPLDQELILTEDGYTEKEKKELSQEEKEYKSMRKQIQEKLIKFATRIPVFMYLTDYREQCLKDVITQLEPALFKKVTGLAVEDFDLLVSIGVFNGAIMNDAIFKFKRYEDASLTYVGIDKHEGEKVGGFDTVLTQQEYKARCFYETPPARAR